MQERLQIPREKLRGAVAASLKKTNEEGLKRKKRIYKLSDLPFNESEEERNTKAVVEFMVDPSTDNLLGTLTDEEFLKVIEKNMLDFWMKNEPEAQKLTEEDNKMMRDTFAMLLNGIVAEFKDPDDKKTLQYYNSVFALAKRKKVAPRAIFESDTYYRELLRNVYSYEEQKARAKKALAFFDTDKLAELLFKPLLKSMVETEEEFAEIYAEMKNELIASPEFQEKISAIRTANEQVMKEELDRIYGKKAKTKEKSK